MISNPLAIAALAVFGLLHTPNAKAAGDCPSPGTGETDRDCPWASVARALIAQAGSPDGFEGLSAVLSARLPELNRAISRDARRTSWKALWGRSINYDELAKGEIVHPAILGLLSEKFGIGKTAPGQDPEGHPLAHAGMEHTYGYLFSVLKTPYGFKRSRWVDGEIERGFGLPAGSLGPKPRRGTLFSNVTYFAGRIAFRDHPGRIQTLKAGAGGVDPGVRGFDFASLSPVRLEETVRVPGRGGESAGPRSRTVALRTDLVPMPHPQADSHWLIYSVNDASLGGPVLISAFPVTSAFVAQAIRPERLGEHQPIQTRYNAFVDGITGHKLEGTRRLVK